MPTAANPNSNRAAAERMLASADEWRLTDYCCTAGPDDPALEEAHDGVTIAVVVDGRFRYRSDGGTVNFFPGSFLLGNACACYRCDHIHGVGDRCVVLSLRPDYFAEIAHAASGDSRQRFARSLLPPSRATLRWSVAFQLAAEPHAAIDDEALVVDAATAIAAHIAGTSANQMVVAARDGGRIRAICDLLTAANDDVPDLSGLAALAGFSKFHFLRAFRAETGTTPHQFRLQQRMRRAALRLTRTREPVAHIAFDAGFGDLSTFNARFRRCFGMTPTAFRRAN